jgi:hypothetical protein
MLAPKKRRGAGGIGAPNISQTTYGVPKTLPQFCRTFKSANCAGFSSSPVSPPEPQEHVPQQQPNVGRASPLSTNKVKIDLKSGIFLWKNLSRTRERGAGRSAWRGPIRALAGA